MNMTDEQMLKRDLDMDKVYAMCDSISKTLTVAEQLKLFRELSYAMVCYFGETDKGILYREISGRNPRHADNVRQANNFQRKLRDMCDFLAQSLVDYRVFDENYIDQYEYAAVYFPRIKELENEIKELRFELYGEEEEENE